MSDARLGGKADIAATNLLRITGEDAITVDHPAGHRAAAHALRAAHKRRRP
jgi:hypothetical protein